MHGPVVSADADGIAGCPRQAHWPSSVSDGEDVTEMCRCPHDVAIRAEVGETDFPHLGVGPSTVPAQWCTCAQPLQSISATDYQRPRQHNLVLAGTTGQVSQSRS